MTKKETTSRVKEVREFSRKLASSKKASRDFLANAGICDKDGRLKKAYR